MAMLGRTIGLDLGSHAIKLVEIRHHPRRLEIARVQALRRPDDLDALLQEIASADLEGARVVCALPADRVTRRALHFPFRDRKRVEQAVPFEVENETPFDLDDIWVDYERTPVTGGEGLDVAASVVRRSEVDALARDLHAAGLKPRILEAEGLALGNLQSLTVAAGAQVIADVGHRKTTLCLLVDGQPRAAKVISVAGAALLGAIASEGLSPRDAEEAIARDGIFADGVEPISARVGDVLERLSKEWVRALAGFEAQLGGPAEETIGGQILVGGVARTPRLDAFLRRRTGIETRRFEVPPQQELGELVAAGDPCLFGPALALALRGTSRARTRSNFLRGEWAPRVELGPLAQQFRGTGLLAAAAVALALLSSAGRYALADRRADALDDQLDAIWSESVPGAARPGNVPGALKQALRDTRDRASTLGLYGGNLSALDLLTEISTLVPGDLSLIFEELAIDGQVVRIRGHSPSFAAVDQLQASLRRDSRFDDIRVSEIQADAKRGGNTFSLTISLAPAGASS